MQLDVYGRPCYDSWQVLVLHGGLGDGAWDISERCSVANDLRPLRNVFEPGMNPVIVNMLWSDPTDSDSLMKLGVHQTQRGQGILEFGPDITASFCERNQIDLVIRSHQYVREGFKIMHSGRLITLFSGFPGIPHP